MDSAKYAEITSSTAARIAHPSRVLAVLIAGAAMMQAAVMIASTASILLFATAFGDRWGGIPGTAGVLGTAAGSIGLTWLMGRTGRRFGLTAAYTVAAIGAGLAIAGSLVEPVLAVGGLFLIGVGGAGSQLARYAAAELYPESRKGFALGAVVWAGSIGAVGGSAMLAPATDLAAWLGLPPLTGAFLLALVGVSVAGSISAALPRFANPCSRRTPALSPAPPLASRAIRVALAAMTVNQVVMVAIMITAPLHMHHQGYGLGTVGIVISVHVLGMYALAPLSGYLTDRFGSPRVLVLGLLLAGGSAAALVSVPNMTGTGLLVVLFVLGFGWNLTLIGGSALVAREVPEADQLRVQGAVEAAVWGASALATFLSTQLFAVGGYQLVAVASLALVAIPLLSIARSCPTRAPTRRQDDDEPSRGTREE